MTRILGIDPGSRVTGFGIIEARQQKAVFITCGCIRTHTAEMPERLHEIYTGLQTLIGEYQPTVLAIEQVFVSRNVSSALKLGQARGVAIVAAVVQGLAVFEYAPTQIKQAVVGQGHAQKEQVQQMVKILLCLSAIPQADAADALAVAICHLHTYQHQQQIAKSSITR
ncbi:crossover junction endodeoxyribonuclease RuvC [Beggiatoa leptomitoformis]|uniref:Crossover junction endodeoxyribonuclease RuvC n=1 Tax=Beggiatoa leptomitoformis TaxID=288004 RepID=A0A2N9YAE3_9GAMM|nr:crossover junction endodeoxyribonuclease RuvC [Beggiatoa leptomitoformis]ALG67156.1 crossover junction endodeoxyribonuclease RuvC [Beggiatoa leptomitoformis]AUI67443.1 crossover junction endodeoxyribonuclease RuvC [Beggiatoa leptomitoformis]